MLYVWNTVFIHLLERVVTVLNNLSVSNSWCNMETQIWFWERVEGYQEIYVFIQDDIKILQYSKELIYNYHHLNKLDLICQFYIRLNPSYVIKCYSIQKWSKVTHQKMILLFYQCSVQIPNIFWCINWWMSEFPL